MKFKQYQRKEKAELREVTGVDIIAFNIVGELWIGEMKISISQADLEAGSPKLGDMIARNPRNHLDQWLVAQQYFQDNFELC